jgi:hypothetical protein
MSQFYVAHPTDATSTLNAALAQGLNLFFTPGIYQLTETLHVTRAGTYRWATGRSTTSSTVPVARPREPALSRLRW